MIFKHFTASFYMSLKHINGLNMFPLAHIKDCYFFSLAYSVWTFVFSWVCLRHMTTYVSVRIFGNPGLIFTVLDNVRVKNLQSCPTLPDPMNCRLAGSSWDSPGKSIGVGCHTFLQGIFSTQGLNPYLFCLLYWQAGSLPLAPPGKLLKLWLKSTDIPSFAKNMVYIFFLLII